jgi:site-specific recombinase XerD
MTEACVAITRGGVTYRIPKATGSEASAPAWLHASEPSYVVAPAAAENGNALPPPASAVLARLRNTLDLRDRDDLRAAAILAVLCAGVRKNELIALDAADLSEVDGVLTLRIRRLRSESRVRERSVQVPPDAASLLRRYWARERVQASAAAPLATAAASDQTPLFWTLGRHGRCRRTRITGHAVNYWLEQLRRRLGLDQRLTARSLAKPLRQAVLVLR